MSELPVESEPISEVDRLRQEIADLISSGIVEIAARNPNVLEYMRHWEGRAEKAEAALAASDTRIAELEAEVERLKAGPKVKPLEWETWPNSIHDCRARTEIGPYEIVSFMGTGKEPVLRNRHGDSSKHENVAAAKAAAQADYEARILSALVQP